MVGLSAPVVGRAGRLEEHVRSVPLVDHHVHGAFRGETDRADFEMAINEGSPDPIPGWMTQFDSAIGFAIRRWCAPVLDLPAHAPAQEYWERRVQLGVAEVSRRFLQAAGVSDWLLDTGHGTDAVLDPVAMAAASGSRSHEICRLESVAEALGASSPAGRDYPDLFRSRLAAAAADAVGVKTVLAYRCGFNQDLSRPDDREVSARASRWVDGGAGKLVDPVLLRFGLHAAVDLGLPIQIHTGFGDRDLTLHDVNPSLLTDLLRHPGVCNVAILLLHCYPYHREAGYLAQAFPNVYFDVGETINYVGVRSAAVVAETFELAPFAKQLYSSDAWGPPELHYLGSMLWRRSVATTFSSWVEAGDWSAADAERVVDMVAHENARRVYQLS